MEINALLMGSSDNVVTCVNEVAAGQPVVYRRGDTTTPARLAISISRTTAGLQTAPGQPLLKLYHRF